MKTIDQIQDEVVDEFSAFDDWMDKYALLIDLGNSLPPLDEKYKTESNLIEGAVRVGYGFMPNIVTARFFIRPRVMP
mgnify:CR=1 FL=1